MEKEHEENFRFVIRWTIRVEGVVEPRDVVGTLFRQTDGFLRNGEGLDGLKESGDVDGIRVEIDSNRGRTTGQIFIRSSLSPIETAELAALVETIEEIGPCSATIEADLVEPAKTQRRRYIERRAQELLEESEIPTGREEGREVP